MLLRFWRILRRSLAHAPQVLENSEEELGPCPQVLENSEEELGPSGR